MATEQKIPKLVASLVEHQEEFSALSGKQVKWVIKNPVPAIKSFVRSVSRNRKVESTRKPLRFLKSFKVGGGDRFVASEHFNVDTSDEAPVKISSISADFKVKFHGITEKNITDTTIRVHTLLSDSRDPEIITGLGDGYTLFLAHIWNLMLLHAKGKNNYLLTNGGGNIFYVVDANSIVWAVALVWGNPYWNIHAVSIGDQRGWDVNDQIYSR